MENILNKEAVQRVQKILNDYNKDLKAIVLNSSARTAKEAAELAKNVGAKNLILTHFSARYNDESVLLNEAKQIHESVIAAKDLLEIEI